MTRKRLMVRSSISTVPRCTFSARARKMLRRPIASAPMAQGSNG